MQQSTNEMAENRRMILSSPSFDNTDLVINLNAACAFSQNNWLSNPNEFPEEKRIAIRMKSPSCSIGTVAKNVVKAKTTLKRYTLPGSKVDRSKPDISNITSPHNTKVGSETQTSGHLVTS